MLTGAIGSAGTERVVFCTRHNAEIAVELFSAGTIMESRRSHEINLTRVGCIMTKADEFRQYAEEALRGAFETESDKKKEELFKLARLWAQAASTAEQASSSPIFPSN
jgi:hypothetical protein